ncbi:MAG: hypothetical protein HQM03_13435 [Magnetococcales bacterium]|nr:hypothetical protein [Magnetococcales bacterium]
MQYQLLNLLRQLRKQDSCFRKIRVGSNRDGGYVLPDDLEGIAGVISLGIGQNVAFDAFFADRGVDVYQYDPTIDAPPRAHPRFHFQQVGLGPADTPPDQPVITHTVGPDGHWIQVPIHTRRLPTILADHGLEEQGDLILKMDIEAAEYAAFGVLTDLDLLNFRIITAELHHLTLLGDPAFFQAANHLVSILTRHHACVHLHANNCCNLIVVEGIPIPEVIEITFLRRDRSSFTPSSEPIPSPLDFPNRLDRPDYVLTAFS